jgi:hypothetical protein
MCVLVRIAVKEESKTMNLPKLIEDDKRIGALVHSDVSGDGVLLHVRRFEDGVEIWTVDLGKGHQVTDDSTSFTLEEKKDATRRKTAI